MINFFKQTTVIWVLFILLVSAWGVILHIQLDQDCTGHLKRAADANTIELAAQELKVSIDYLEASGDTIGYTSVIWTTPDEDLGFWYKNLVASYEELISIPADATQLEKSNTLMKLRETLLDTDNQGATEVTCPTGLSRYPHNGLFGTLFYLFSILTAIGIFFIGVDKNK